MIAYRICNEAAAPADAGRAAAVAAGDRRGRHDGAREGAREQRFQSARGFLSALHAVAAGVAGRRCCRRRRRRSSTLRSAITCRRCRPHGTTRRSPRSSGSSRAFVGPVAKVLVRNAAPHAHDAAELYSLLGAQHPRSRGAQAFRRARAGRRQHRARRPRRTGPHAAGARRASGSHPRAAIAAGARDRPSARRCRRSRSRRLSSTRRRSGSPSISGRSPRSWRARPRSRRAPATNSCRSSRGTWARRIADRSCAQSNGEPD